MTKANGTSVLNIADGTATAVAVGSCDVSSSRKALSCVLEKRGTRTGKVTRLLDRELGQEPPLRSCIDDDAILR